MNWDNFNQNINKELTGIEVTPVDKIEPEVRFTANPEEAGELKKKGYIAPTGGYAPSGMFVKSRWE